VLHKSTPTADINPPQAVSLDSRGSGFGSIEISRTIKVANQLSTGSDPAAVVTALLEAGASPDTSKLFPHFSQACKGSLAFAKDKIRPP
jgi:hypothetical protein